MRRLIGMILFSLFIANSQARGGPLIPPPLSAGDIPGESASEREQERKMIPPARMTQRAKRRPKRRGAARHARQPVVVVGWSDGEVDSAVDKLATDLLADRSKRLARLKRRLKRRLVLRISPVRNRSGEHIDTGRLDRRAAARLSSGRALTLARKAGQGADLLLLSALMTLNDAVAGTELRCYIMTWSLIDVVTGEKVWVGIDELRKLIHRPKVGPSRVTVLPLGQAVDLSGSFNDHDARTIGRALASKLVASPFLQSRQPVKMLRMAPLRNRTSAHLPTRFISSIIERELIGQPGVIVLGSRNEMDGVRKQRTLPRPGGSGRGKEYGATHVISGSISSTTSAVGNNMRSTYTISLEAIDPSTHQKEWMAVKSVAKVTSAPSTRW